MRIAILGSGPGGYVAAIKAAQLGAEVTIVEEGEVGGTCLNWGCIPTKTLTATAEALAAARGLEAFGIELKGGVSPNLAKIMERKTRVVSTLTRGIQGLFKNRGVTLKRGRGVLASNREIDVTSPDGSRERIAADSIIIATGSRPARMPSIPFDGNHVISSTEALEIREVPQRLLIVGGGVIGCEFACIYRELGSEVTIIEALPRAVATEDAEISEILEKELKKKKIRLLTGAQITGVSVREGTAHAQLSDGRELSGDKVLVSVGRALNTENIGIEHLGMGKGSRGEILVNGKMETNVPGIFAIGDVTGGMLLAHKASAEGIVAAKNIMGIPCSMDYQIIPSAIFTSPEIASVGLREHQAVEKGISFRKGIFPFRALGKAHAMGEISGIVKVLSDASTDRIIGAHIIGPHASDLIHEAAVAMKAGISSHELAGTIHAHPTLSEALMEAAEDVNGEAIHLPKK